MLLMSLTPKTVSPLHYKQRSPSPSSFFFYNNNKHSAELCLFATFLFHLTSNSINMSTMSCLPPPACLDINWQDLFIEWMVICLEF